MIMKVLMRLKPLIVITVLVSCATLAGKAYLPALPRLETVPPAGEVVSEREAILERNLLKVLEWVEVVWRGNK
jgi:hypothetical protein